MLLTCRNECYRVELFVLRRCFDPLLRGFRAGNITLACGYRKARTASDQVIGPVSQRTWIAASPPPLHWPDQTDISTQEKVSPARPRLSAPDEHPWRSPRDPQPPRQRATAAGWLSAGRAGRTG